MRSWLSIAVGQAAVTISCFSLCVCKCDQSYLYCFSLIELDTLLKNRLSLWERGIHRHKSSSQRRLQRRGFLLVQRSLRAEERKGVPSLNVIWNSPPWTPYHPTGILLMHFIGLYNKEELARKYVIWLLFWESWLNDNILLTFPSTNHLKTIWGRNLNPYSCQKPSIETFWSDQ